MKNKKITASILSASLLATPTIAQIGTLTVFAQENAENAANIPYDGNHDCVTGEEVTQGLSLMVQNQVGGDYKNCGVKIYKLPDDATIDGVKQDSTINGESADKYDLNNATLVTTYHTISLDDRIWTNSDGSITERDGDVGMITGHPTFRSLDTGKYVLVYDGDYAGFDSGIGIGGTYQRVAFEVTQDTMTSIDVEESEKAKVPEVTNETGSVELQAILVETDENGNVKKDDNGKFIPTGENVENVSVNPNGDMYLTDEVINNSYEQYGGLMSKDAIVSMLKLQGYKDVRNLSLTTNSEGKANSSDIEVGDYTMKTTIPEGYSFADEENDSNFTYSVQKDGTDVHVIELYKTPEKDDNTPEKPNEVPQGIRVLVKDRETGETIEGAKFNVVASNDKDFSFSDDSTKDGVVKTVSKADTYTASLISVPSDYKLNVETASVTLKPVTKDGVITDMTLYVDKAEDPVETGALVSIVRDKDTKNPIPNAKVEIVDKDGKTILETTTDSNGKFSKDELPIGDYTIKVKEVPNGYNIPDNQVGTVKKNETTTIIFELEKTTSSLDITVRDKDTKAPIPNAKVEIVDKNGNTTTTTTDSNGKVTKDNLPIGDYTIKVVEVPNGYNKPNDQTTTIKKNETSSLIFELEKGVGALDVTVRDKNTKVAIPNATIQIVDKDGKTTNATTNANGKVNKDNLPIGDYTIKVVQVPSGYNIPTNQTTTIKKNETSSLIFELEKGVGNLDVIVRDKDTKVAIPNAKVEIIDKNNKVYYETTDNNGKISKSNLPIGDYTIKVVQVPDGYTIPNNQKGTVNKNQTTTIIFELEKGVGALDVIVRDKDTKVPIPNATIQVVDKNGNVITSTKTDSNGRVNKDKLPIGDYTINVVQVPDGYNIPSNQTVQVKKNILTTVIFELEKGVGSLDVIVRDKDTKEPIPNATIQIVDKNGNLLDTTTTDSNGKVTKDKLPTGDYTIKVVQVPNGYTKPEDQTATIKRNEKTTTIFELDKETGSLDVIVRDKDTKVPIPNAKVEVVDENNNTILETTTDSNGTISKDKLPTGNYTVRVIEVPDGYNKPNDQTITIKDNIKTTVIFELDKNTVVTTNNTPNETTTTNDTTPSNHTVQTGDNNNILGLALAGVVSVCGMLLAFVKRKK